MKLIMQVHCYSVHVSAYFQVPTLFIYGDIAKTVFLPYNIAAAAILFPCMLNIILQALPS